MYLIIGGGGGGGFDAGGGGGAGGFYPQPNVPVPSKQLYHSYWWRW